ncbi:MAG: FtsX-like permease family protein [Proteobacteria bacterium]|nr:FtsX-like permease family protein [Pseudomonadota bacterium]
MHFSVALKLLWRDWRAGELTLLLVSLIIAVSTVTTITLFVDRLQQALLRESSTFLAADRVISSSRPIADDILIKAGELGLQQAQTLSFLSMVFSDDRAQFTAVKAVDDYYPLRGKLIVSDAPFVRGTPVESGPLPGEIWLESRLLPSLGVDKGDILDIGVASFSIGNVLVKEPDRGSGFNSVGPRVLMNLADVPLTEVVQPGSRLTYRYLFAGEVAALDVFQAWAKPRLGVEARMFGVKEGAAGIGNALDRAERFLLLGGLLGVILAGIAIALAAQRYSLRHYDHVAILKTLGATPAGIDTIFVVIFLILGTLATILGSCIGFVVQMAAVKILEPLIPIELPNPGLRPVVLGLVTGFVCLLSFALPPLLKLRAIVPVRVMRRDLGETGIADRMTYSFAIIGIIGLMWWYSQDLRLTMLIFSGGVAATLVMSVLAYGLLRSGRIFGMQAGSAWRLALAGMQRRGQENVLQILVFGLAIMLLLILYLVRTALVEEWRAQIPENAPNHFAINITPEDVGPIRQLFHENGVASQPFYPMTRGRITSVNGQLSRERDRQREAAADSDGPRESSGRNLTWAADLPADNRIVAGKWWPENYQGPVQVSLEKDLAQSNRLKVGDELVFTIQGRKLAAIVASIRTVAWDNMQPNFYIIFSPGALGDFPSTYMTSFFLEKHEKLFLNTLLNQYPTMTVIEVDALIEQIQRIITQVTLAIELVLVLILVSGGLVLLASIQASMDERLKQHAIIRTLGGSQKLVLGSLAIEFGALGFFAGVLATFGSEITVYWLQTEIFQLDYKINPELWVLGPLVGTLLIGVVGTLAALKVVRTPPITVLREL